MPTACHLCLSSQVLISQPCSRKAERMHVIHIWNPTNSPLFFFNALNISLPLSHLLAPPPSPQINRLSFSDRHRWGIQSRLKHLHGAALLQQNNLSERKRKACRPAKDLFFTNRHPISPSQSLAGDCSGWCWQMWHQREDCWGNSTSHVPPSESHSTQKRSRLHVALCLLTTKPCKQSHGFPDTSVGNSDLSVHPNPDIQRSARCLSRKGQALPQSLHAGVQFSEADVTGLSMGTFIHPIIYEASRG